VALFDARELRAAHVVPSRAERLRCAIAGGELALDRQPVVDVHSGATDHHVLVARVPGADPDSLLDSAERFGLGGALDHFTLDHALSADPSAGVAVVPVTAGAPSQRAFADWLLGELAGRPGAGERLVLAVPEVAALADLAAIRSLAARLGEFGARLALDDFGRLGAFSLLKLLPVHQVRLSAKLVRGLPGSDRDRAVVLALVQAAEALGAQTVATGVDGRAELTAVRGFGITLAQGAGTGATPRRA
jgi:EAL domain-containing protein (putative c-di-GMP-specific phosphodiesterase class I)